MPRPPQLDYEDSDVESDWEEPSDEEPEMKEASPLPYVKAAPVPDLPEDDEYQDDDEYECARCILVGREPVGSNDGGACCRQCFAEATPDFFATTYHANNEHHACGPDFPESEAALYERAGHGDMVPRLRAEWRHAHAEWHAANGTAPGTPAGALPCPSGDHSLCEPEHGLGCTAAEAEALSQVLAHNADVHDCCPEDYPVLMMRRPDHVAFTNSEVAFALALWRHSHLRHEFCGPYVANGYPEFDCSLATAAEHAAEWEQVVADRAAGRPALDNMLTLSVPSIREAAAERARAAADWRPEDFRNNNDALNDDDVTGGLLAASKTGAFANDEESKASESAAAATV